MRDAKLTIGMACYDDFDGVYFTVTSLMLHHADVMHDCEIVVVDNNPDSTQGNQTRRWVENRVPNGKYFAFAGAHGTAQARNEVFRRASAPAVLCIDCHVLLAPEAVARLIEYYTTHQMTRDLLTGPLITDSGRVSATHQKPVWRGGAWGTWAVDDRGNDPQSEPFEIWQQGMGLFSCRRKAWVKFHPDFTGFGGCESYVMHKVRQNNGRVLCCPWLRWSHRFSRPNGVPYSLERSDRIRNYLIGFRELQLNIEPVLEHFNISHEQAESLVQSSRARAKLPALAVAGSPIYAGTHLRGKPLATHWNCELVSDPRQLSRLRHCETLVAVKRVPDASALRKKCDRLIYDPLDSFSTTGRHPPPEEYWRTQYERLRFDDIIATSPACYDVMQAAVGSNAAVHLVPHQCDSRIREDWRNPDGPVVYVGLERFVKSGLDRIRQACRRIGRELVVGRNIALLEGAALALALRLRPWNTALCRHCKPQIKLENAAAAGLPVVATDCLAATSLYPEIDTVPVNFTPSQLAASMHRALDGPGLFNPYRTKDYLGAMDRMLGRPSKVVYTAIFGTDDELCLPQVRTPGVQYICFTDNPFLKSDIWDVRYCKPTGDPLIQSKWFKTLPHKALNCEMSLWVDGKIELHDVNEIFDSINSDIALQRHTSRNCIYLEAADCRRRRRGDPVRIAETVERYRAAGHPPNDGLWESGIILRRHTPQIEAFNNEFWREVSYGTSRDQIVIPYILRRMRIDVHSLSPHVPATHTSDIG